MLDTPPIADVEIAQRVRQQNLIAGFGRFALRSDDLQSTLAEVCRVAAEGLETPFAKVLEWHAATNDFLIRAGVGWIPGVVGHARLGADLASPAGYAFKMNQPVLSTHLAHEARFRTPTVLAEHGIRQAVNVIIADGGTAYGVLEADSTQRNAFVAHDQTFLQALADILGTVIERQREHEALGERETFVREVLEASPSCVKVLDAADGAVRFMNENGRCLLEIGDLSGVLGKPLSDLWPAAEAPKLAQALADARAGKVVRFEAFCPTATGTPKWWDVLVAPLTAREGRPAQLVAISQDVTDRVRAAAGHVLQMQEVHHRVRNSLQLVQGLLGIQSRATGDETARKQLRESAARVRTISTLHDRLYRTGGAPEVEIGPYLAGLIDDLREGVASTLAGRTIRLEADAVTWAASDVPALGLVVTELVTNALKYGAGEVLVEFRQMGGEQAVLAVADEGTGLRADFEPAQSRGLGMRLVTTLLSERGGSLVIDRSVPKTRFVAVMPRPHGSADKP